MSNETEYPEIKHQIDSNGHKPDSELSKEEKIKAAVEKYRPYAEKIWKEKKKLFIFNTIVTVITILYLLFIAKPSYESTVTILPEYGNKLTMLGQLSDLASMAGVNLGNMAPTEIYQNIINSETVIGSVIYAKYKTEEFSDSVNLIQYFEIDPDESLNYFQQKRKMFVEVYKKLIENKIETSFDRKTNILTLTVEMPESKLSADVANNIASSLDFYIRTKRKSYASEQCFYLEKRTKQIFDSMSIAENNLKNFREHNRIIEQSPQLMLEQTRLVRTVEILQTVYGELIKQLEIAKVDKIKDIPIVNIREAAIEPVIKKGPRRLILLFIIMFISCALSITYLISIPEIKKYKNIFLSK